MNNRLKLFDGRNTTDLNTGVTKSIDLPQYPDEAWNWLSGKPDGELPGLQQYYEAIPFLFRGANIRADRVSSMPFSIFRGETEVDSSDDYQNFVKFLPNPKRLFKLIELSLTLSGKSYLFNVRNEVVTKDLKYLNPTTVDEQVEDPEGLVGWKRTTTKGTKDYPVKDIIYFWPPVDPWVEIGSSSISPGAASLMASGVLANVDNFIAAFFGRGAIKQTLWRAEGMAPADQKKFLAKWKRFSVGVRNAFETILFNAQKMEPVVVGEGLEGLQDTDLNTEKKEDIAHAMGVPVSMLFTNASNRATAVVDMFDLYVGTITPEVEFIFSILNEQVFNPMGFAIKDRHETLDVYQKDEQVRSTAYVQYVAADMKPSVAAALLGIELPAGVEYEDLDTDAEEQRKQKVASRPAFGVQQSPGAKEEREASEGKSLAGRMVINHVERETMTISPEARADLAKWERKALRQLKAGKRAACDFESEYLSRIDWNIIRVRLHGATTSDEVKAAFAGVQTTTEPPVPMNDPAIVELTLALNTASKALRETA